VTVEAPSLSCISAVLDWVDLRVICSYSSQISGNQVGKKYPWSWPILKGSSVSGYIPLEGLKRG
jgi:hypothetical protein